MIVTGCGADPDSDPLIVFAASSLTDSFSELSELYEQSTGNRVTLVTAGSSALREQILDGAPAAVLASASESVMDDLEAGGHLQDEAHVFAYNHLVIAVAPGNPLMIESVEDLARLDLVLGACAEGVPCGELAREAFDGLVVKPEFDTREPNVRILLAKLIDGELDAGLVYFTDVLGSGGQVEAVSIRDEGPPTASYPIGVLAGAPNTERATEFVSWVSSHQGRSVLAEHGFDLP